MKTGSSFPEMDTLMEDAIDKVKEGMAMTHVCS